GNPPQEAQTSADLARWIPREGHECRPWQDPSKLNHLRIWKLQWSSWKTFKRTLRFVAPTGVTGRWSCISSAPTTSVFLSCNTLVCSMSAVGHCGDNAAL